MDDSDNEGEHLIFIYGGELPPKTDRVPNILNDYKKGITYKKTGFFGKGNHAYCYEFQNTETQIKYAVKVVSKFVSPARSAKAKDWGRRTQTQDVRVQPIRKEEGYVPSHSRKINQDVFLDHGNNMVFNEASIHKDLRHEHIVRFYSIFEDDINVYLVLEPCIYGTLRQVLDNRTRLTLIETRYYVRQIALACQYLRDQLVIHQDLKPNNVFVDDNMNIKIGDFGLAVKIADSSAKSMLFCGTLNYIAPEIISRTGHSFEVDAWAIGCITYELLVGHPPFLAVSREVTFSLIGTSLHLPIPQEMNLPKSATDFIDQTLQVNRKSRLTPTQILESPFITEGPEIPTSLPVVLLKRLPEARDKRDIEQFVMNLIGTEPKHEIEKPRGNAFSKFIYSLICKCFP